MRSCYTPPLFILSFPLHRKEKDLAAEDLVEPWRNEMEGDCDPRLEYRLTGVVSHEGLSPVAGHYLAYVYRYSLEGL